MKKFMLTGLVIVSVIAVFVVFSVAHWLLLIQIIKL